MRGREESSPQKGEDIKWIAVRTEHQPKSKAPHQPEGPGSSKRCCLFCIFWFIEFLEVNRVGSEAVIHLCCHLRSST